MSAMLSTTPSHSRSGLRVSRASSTTSSACSTPCIAKYCASAEISAWSAATSALTVSRPERGRAVDQDDVVVVGDARQRLAQRELAAHLAPERELGLGQVEVGGDDAVVDRVGGLGPAGEDVADGRARPRVDVQVVGQVALRVEVDHQHLEPERRKTSAQGPDRGRLAGSALLGEDCDGRGHGRRTLARPTGVDVRSPPLRRGPRYWLAVLRGAAPGESAYDAGSLGQLG